ncbi:hypothetical protein NCAS_0E00930 [Naumovozyma castellii]|uniref:Nucleoporin Nup54 alpha-helical domain-containing protein n=1 Tax=Naumovozyma castellii TaxID=27288 RepID=G0VF98_NAUCA|nr:hypothetical protein NCAS_0E00930 [Naumovozyma castellii CBS 4309]CCC70163.1 hypothetical protein NCAS_0E00930 [Naumovozyma castellii CBS 4309]
MFTFNSGANNANTSTIGSTGGMFGNKPTFGASQPTQQPAGGFSFNSNQQNNNQNVGGGSGLFGANANTPQQQQQQSGGMFGNQQNASSIGGGGLFGNKPAQTNTLGTGTTGGLFGQQQQQNTTSGFGAGTTTGGGLFGNTAQNQPTSTGGGLFGSKTAGTGVSGGLFGNNTQNTGASTGGGLFGANNNQQRTGGLFGSKPLGQTTNTPGSLFGNQGTTSNTTGGGLFGNKLNQGSATGGLFGQQQQQQHQPQQQQQTLNSVQPSFSWMQQPGQTTTQQQPIMQTQIYPQQQQQQQYQQSYYPQQIQEQLLKCKESWDPNSNKSKLRTFMYNKVNETEAMLYNKPINIPQEEWDSAIEKRPSSDVIPVQLFGFEGLNQRSQLQVENVAQARLILNQILEKSTQLQQKHELDTAARILKAKSRNAEIERRILKLGTQISILKNRGVPLSISEEKMWSQFQALLKKSEDPAGLGKTNELWARLAVLKERSKNISDQLDNTLVVINANGGNSAASEPNSSAGTGVDEEVKHKIDKIAEILTSQQRGIYYLNEVLEKDHNAIDKALKK